jgi:AcrR family transcriptional regulator
MLTSMTKNQKSPYHHGSLRESLVQASLEVIAEHGPEGFTLRDIARRLGVAPSAPYRHFADKEEVLAAVAAECSERLGAAMDAAAPGCEDPIERFRLVGLAYVRFAVENPAYFKVMSHAHLSGQAPLRANFNDWLKNELAQLRAAQGRGELSQLPVEDIMLAARCLTYGLVRLIVDGLEGFEGISAARATQLAEAVTNVLGLGLLPRTSNLVT